MGTPKRVVYMAGFLIQEIGQAIDHLECRRQGNYGF